MNSSQTIDINECAEQPTICGDYSKCRNTKGSYTCSCAKGYKMKDGKCVG